MIGSSLHTDIQYYRDYYWNQGIPYGIGKSKNTGYKIVMDPYRKWITIECYERFEFKGLIYDSRFLDFRKLQPSEHIAWEKTTIKEAENTVVKMIRNQDDRIMYFETSFFKKNRCQECRIQSPFKTLLSIHKMHYICDNDDFNGVTLFDANAHRVMQKKYEFDTEKEVFTELLNENWNFRPKQVQIFEL